MAAKCCGGRVSGQPVEPFDYLQLVKPTVIPRTERTDGSNEFRSDVSSEQETRSNQRGFRGPVLPAKSMLGLGCQGDLLTEPSYYQLPMPTGV